jgi:hypothetical protein
MLHELSRAAVILIALVGAAPLHANALDKEPFRSVIRSHRPEVTRCYVAGLSRHPDLAGRVVIEIAIAMTGVVTSTRVRSSTLLDEDTERCITARALTWQFPTMPQPMVILYPFVFKTDKTEPQTER